MWILRYQYDLADGNLNKVSCCLKHGKTYNIGRSSKNLLNVKNDKSISREHISICWGNGDDSLKLNNQGKMTAASGRYLKIGESTSFSKSMGTVLVELGTKPLNIHIQWLSCSWLIPYKNLSDFASLREFGIEVSSSNLQEADLIVMNKEPDYRQWLYGLARKIPLMNLEFLEQCRLYLASNGTKFDSFWSQKMNDKNFRYTSKDIPNHILQGLEFFTIGRDDETLLAIEAAGGKYSSAISPQELQEIIKKKENTDNIVIITSPSTKSEEILPKSKAFTMQDVMEAIFKNNVNSLKNGIPKEAAERSEDREQGEKIVKKRKLGRPRVKPLDILSFFAGGDSMRESPESTIKLDSQIKEPKKPEEHGSIIREEHPESDHLSQGSKRESTVVLEPETPKELEKKSTNESEYGKSKTKNARASIEPTTESTQNFINPPSQEAVPPSGMSYRRKPTLHNQDNEASPENKMIQIIQDTKNREVRRLNSTIIQIGDEELTEDAINKLGDLVLVDQNDHLLRRREQTPSTLDSHNSDWNNRKNFKNFVKVLPKYRRSKAASREGSSDTIRNRAFLLTREYVPMKTYTGTDSSQSMQDDIQEDIRDFPRLQTGAHLEPQVEPHQGASVPNNLFVTDEDDSQEDIVLEEPQNSVPPALSHLVNDKCSDTDSDDDEPKFEFKRNK